MNNIPEFIAESAKNYYNYLYSKNKGIRIVSIKKISLDEEHSENTLKLFFDEKVVDFDYVNFIFVDDVKVERDRFKVVKSDPYSATLAMPSYLFFCFRNCKSAKLVIDFKQLVYRVQKKFENLQYLHCPTKESQIKFDYNKFSDVPFSTQQLNAITSIFSSPVSYIWGVAGSGKTKYVLAYAVMNYLLAGKKILLTAPTNIALENALSAIIPIARKHGLKDSLIFRAGVPSTQFHDDFPGCCESRNLVKKNKILSETKNNIVSYIHATHILNLLPPVKDAIVSIFDAKETLLEIEHKSNRLCTEIKSNTQAIERETAYLQAVGDTLQAVMQQKRSLIYKIKRVFSSGENLDEKLSELTASFEKSNYRINELYDSNDKISVQLNINQNNEKELHIYISEQEKKISEEISPHFNIAFDVENHERLNQQISAIEKAQKQLQQSIAQKYPDIDFSDTETLDKKLRSITEEINSSIEQKEKQKANFLVYGCTLDKLMSCEIHNDEFEHVFLDEACYSCIAKAAVVFMCECPVTFLGDHMQLPPVSELSQDDFKTANLSKDLFIWLENGIYSYNLFDISFTDMFNDFVSCSEHISNNVAISKLSGTHRFGRELSKILDQYVYGIGLHSIGNSSTKISIIDVPHSPGAKKRTNTAEAIAIREYIEKSKPENYIVLAPYKNQVELIRSELPSNMRANVLTVHKSQGQEWDCVILSVTDTTDKFFTDSQIQISHGKELLNTAISRAKKQIVIVCDVQYWKKQSKQLITELINI